MILENQINEQFLERLPEEEVKENKQKFFVIDIFLMLDIFRIGKVRIDFDEFVWEKQSEITT